MSSQELERQLEATRHAAEETMARLTAEVVAARKREEEAEKARRLQEEAKRALERQRRLEEERKAEEIRRKAEETKKAEEERRKAEEMRKAEEERRAEEERKAKMERLKELDEELRKMNVAQLQDWMDTKAEAEEQAMGQMAHDMLLQAKVMMNKAEKSKTEKERSLVRAGMHGTIGSCYYCREKGDECLRPSKG